MSDLPDNVRTGIKALKAAKGAVAAAPIAGSIFNSAVASGTGLLLPSAPFVLAAAVLGGGAWLGWRVGSAIVDEMGDWLGSKK